MVASCPRAQEVATPDNCLLLLEVGMAYLVETPAAERIPVTAAMGRFWLSFPLWITGAIGEGGKNMADAWFPFAEAVSDIARTHTDDGTRLFARLYLSTFGPWELVVRQDRWDWCVDLV